jgi:probable LLM family oxidoreductase
VNSINQHFEIGCYTLVEWDVNPLTGKKLDARTRIQHLLETIDLADQVGLDVFGIGEHHRPDFLSSAPLVILGAAAARSKKIHLSTAVTVLSSDDPVRVFQDFATLDLLSEGRAEIMAGRGAFIESFPLFGYDLNDYDSLFVEKLDLLLKLRRSEFVSWSGRHRSTLEQQGIFPRPLQEEIPIWVAVGGTPESASRAGTLGLPVALGIIGGMPEKFLPLVELHQSAWKQAGHDPAKWRLSVNSRGFVGVDSKQAANDYFPFLKAMMDKLGRERGFRGLTRSEYEASRGLHGSDYVGSPDEVIEKILFQQNILHFDRLLLQMDIGAVTHEALMRSIELLGTKVAPVIREEMKIRSGE